MGNLIRITKTLNKEKKMDEVKIYKSKLILESQELQAKSVNLLDAKSVVSFAEDTLRIGSYPEEVVFVICMNPSKECINYFELSRGTLLSSYIGMKELMKRVLISNAHSFVLVHNHPCGEAIPTDEDYHLTGEIQKAAKLLHIDFIDHVIVGQRSYASLRQLVEKAGLTW